MTYWAGGRRQRKRSLMLCGRPAWNSSKTREELEFDRGTVIPRKCKFFARRKDRDHAPIEATNRIV